MKHREATDMVEPHAERRDVPDGALLLTVPQAARLAAVGRSTAYELVRRGVWPAVRISSKLTRIPRRALEAWIAAEMAAATSPEDDDDVAA